MKDAAFITTAKDLTLHSTEGPPLAFKRYYSSRSHYLGWFGFGWCTDFEKKIEFLSDQKIRLEDCKMSGPENFSPSQYKRTQDRITITSSDKTTTEYDAKGRLIKISSADLKASLTYLGNNTQIKATLSRGISSTDDIIQVTFDPSTNFIKEIKTNKNQIQYEYDGDNLSAVKENKIVSFNYHYDDYQNIERIDYKDQTFETIAYETNQDRVRLFRDRQGCIEKFSFEKDLLKGPVLPRSGIQTGLSKVERLCQGRLVAHALFKIGPGSIVSHPKIERLPSNTEELQ